MTTPRNFHVSAQGHLLAAEILSNNLRKANGDISPIIFAYYNNVGLSIELYLKCYLRWAGVSERQLSRWYLGHDIAYIHSVATELYELDYLNEQIDRIIGFVGEQYMRHFFRYQNDEDVFNHIDEGQATSVTFTVLKHFDEYLRNLISD